ncbi:MAG: lecithin retinol acyltransferase family protein [Planctomycetota bacterium]|nr:lecithin retinol acyltransferase family protein [Planctomycetota bacterium]
MRSSLRNSQHPNPLKALSDQINVEKSSRSQADFQPADHLFIDCGGYSHHGIYLGNHRVIHFESTLRRKLPAFCNKNPPRIQEVTIDDFAANQTIHVRHYTLPVFSPATTIALAQSQVGKTGYSLLQDNCEHFAVWCKTGRRQSTQVSGAWKAATAGVAALPIAAAITRSARLMPIPCRLLTYTAAMAIVAGTAAYQFTQEKILNRVNNRS